MHPTQKAQKLAVARETVVSEARALAANLNLPPKHVEELETAKHRDADIFLLRQLEAISGLLVAANKQLTPVVKQRATKRASKAETSDDTSGEG